MSERGREGRIIDEVSIVSENSGEGGGPSPTQHSLTTKQKSLTASTQKHATSNTQPPSTQQATAPVRPIRTPLLPAPHTHTDTNRTRGGERGDWQTGVNKYAHMADRQTRKHIRAALRNIHTVNTQPPQTNTS